MHDGNPGMAARRVVIWLRNWHRAQEPLPWRGHWIGFRGHDDDLSREGGPSAPPCDHSYRDTIRFLEKKKLDAQRVMPWLRGQGGYCDCEVLGESVKAHLAPWSNEKRANKPTTSDPGNVTPAAGAPRRAASLRCRAMTFLNEDGRA